MAVFQAVLLYGSETWVMTPRIGSTLGIFHHRVARILTVRQLRRVIDGRWGFPLLAEAMEESVLQEVETYVSSRQNIVAQFITTSPIISLCLVVERCPGSLVPKLRWYQEGLDWVGMRTASW